MKNHNSKRLKNICRFLGIFLAIPVIFVVLILYKPAGSRPGKPIIDKQVSPYLTHVLSPQLYNGAQLQEPFEVVITEEGINDIVSRYNWPIESDGVLYFTPKVFFKPGHIILSVTVATRGIELAVTITGNPIIDKEGFLNLNVTAVRVGAVNMTLISKIIASRMYTNKAEPGKIDANNIRVKIAGSLLNNEPFEPIFEVKDKKIRIEKMALIHKQLSINFVPAS